MLKELMIKDFAVIEDLEIEFKMGMSAILGETGAGKSIIIDAFSLLLGSRANSDMIRSGKTKAFVQAKISFNDIPVDLKEYEDENNDFIFTRIINKDGNNTCKINGINVPTSILKSTLAKKVNLHSQHDLFYLLDSKYHLSLLDKFIGNDLNEKLLEYQKSYNQYLAKLDDYNKLINENNNIDIDYIKYQLEEIQEIDLKENEFQEIESELLRISKYDKVSNAVTKINDLFDKNEGICDLLYEVKRIYKNISDDPLFAQYESKLIDIYELVNEINTDIKESYNSLEFDESRLEYLKDRLFQINKLKRKYGSYNEVCKIKEEYKTKIEYFNDKDYYIEKLEKEINELKNETYLKAKTISTLRKNKAEYICNKVIGELKDLYLDNTIFEAKFSEIDFTYSGIDKIEFMISTNVGEDVKPLSQIVSGGEASRITLALNVVFNEAYNIDLAIFDEVDSGVSGKIARSMGKKMRDLSKLYQTITISHLPQVLSYSDNYYYIGKEVVNGKTRSYIKNLNKEEQVFEIAKILSGSDNPSNTFINNARELLEV